MAEFVRFQSAVPNKRGRFPGVFAMANGLRSEGLLSADELRWLQESNAAANDAYSDPSTVTPDCYDLVLNPGARSWFKADASELLQMTAGYLQLLDRHGIQWMELRTRTPGRIVYEDTVQVVAVPYTYRSIGRLAVKGQMLPDMGVKRFPRSASVLTS